MLVLVFVERKANRLQYALTTLLTKSLGLDFELTMDVEYFKSSNQLKINYSPLNLPAVLQIVPHSILFDYGIKDYPIEVHSSEQYGKCFFNTSKLPVPFDLFGASFWLLTRYEEYLPHKIDKYQRFSYQSSLAYQHGFIEVPLINKWLNQLLVLLDVKTNPEYMNPNRYQFLSSIDIDNAYKYQYKGFVRSLAGVASDLFKNEGLLNRLRVLIKKERDPYDAYDFLIDTHKKSNVKTIYFFLIGDYGINDKNHAATNQKFQSLIKRLADYSMIGVHPSYGSKNKLQQLQVEISRLSKITHKTIRKSRQHYSILNFPSTYKQLLQASISEDFSMGYTNCNGFRASYCLPFNWYNLIEEKMTDLILYPYCISEITLIKKAEKSNFKEVYEPIINEIKKYNGFNCIIFHNDNFNEEVKKLYLEMLAYSKD
ncbi:MAG: polysaccharide deacetylase family protein [Bacteroidetes bacterium]|nr:polysaccharide deacetylase family protein [Bacteroidota bacterium]